MGSGGPGTGDGEGKGEGEGEGDLGDGEGEGEDGGGLRTAGSGSAASATPWMYMRACCTEPPAQNTLSVRDRALPAPRSARGTNTACQVGPTLPSTK